MKTAGLSQTFALLVAGLSLAGPIWGQARPTAGQSLNVTFVYTRKQVPLDVTGMNKPIEAMFTLPRRDRPCPAVLFVTGAWNASKVGLTEGDELHSLADYLGAHGIAVLQLPRPSGGRSIADLSSATPADFEPDIRAGLAYLKAQPGIDFRQIGLFGQNENGAIASVMATLNKDVTFVILGGTPIVAFDPTSRPSKRVNAYDLRPVMERVTCPVLVMQGDQEPITPVRQNLTAYRNVLVTSKNRDTAFVALPGVNRAMETTLGNGKSESDMAPMAMRTLTRWVYRDVSESDLPIDLLSNGDEQEKATHRKPTNLYGDVPGGVIGQFRYRPEMAWIPPVADQPRPYGYWYW